MGPPETAQGSPPISAWPSVVVLLGNFCFLFSREEPTWESPELSNSYNDSPISQPVSEVSPQDVTQFGACGWGSSEATSHSGHLPSLDLV